MLCTKTRGDSFGASRFSKEGSVSAGKRAPKPSGIQVEVMSDHCAVVRLNDIALSRCVEEGAHNAWRFLL